MEEIPMTTATDTTVWVSWKGASRAHTPLDTVELGNLPDVSFQLLCGRWTPDDVEVSPATTEVHCQRCDSVLATEAPLQNCRIIGVLDRVYRATPEAPAQPGGSCWHCGQAIMVCVQVQDTVTREIHEIGTTCAERVGLSGPELKRMLADRYAEQRALERLHRSKEYRSRVAVVEIVSAWLHGEHGTESRFLSGCDCRPCLAAAPHGTFTRFNVGRCACLDCIAAAIATGQYKIRENWPVIVRLSTGEMVEARVVDGQWGASWRVNNGEEWLRVNPARRSTHAKKGFVQAECPFLLEECGRPYERWYKPVLALGSPIFDIWGEPIARPVAS
jgi:hypothetical protein